MDNSFRWVRPFQNQDAFTLIEILIALLILAFISLFTAQSIRTAIATKNKMQTDLDQQAQLKNTLAVMERDISLSFHYRDYVTDMMKQLRSGSSSSAPATPATPGVPTTTTTTTIPHAAGPGAPPGGAGGISGIPELDAAAARTDPGLTQFMGDSEELAFSTLSNVRMRSNAPESDQQRVQYSLKPCPVSKVDDKNSPRKNTPGAKCLMRRTWPFLDTDYKNGGNEFVLLENVEDFQLRYLGPDKDGWQKTWFTNERGDTYTKDKFPFAVEVTLTTNWNKRKFTLQTVAQLRFPNNPPKGSETLGGNAGQTPGTPGGATGGFPSGGAGHP